MPAGTGREETLLWGAVTLCGRESGFTVNGESIDITDGCSDGFQELMEESGLNSLEISLSGLDKDDVLLAATMPGGQRIQSLTWTRASGAVIEGDFRLASLSYAAPYNDARTFEATFASTGAYTYTPAVVTP